MPLVAGGAAIAPVRGRGLASGLERPASKCVEHAIPIPRRRGPRGRRALPASPRTRLDHRRPTTGARPGGQVVAYGAGRDPDDVGDRGLGEALAAQAPRGGDALAHVLASSYDRRRVEPTEMYSRLPVGVAAFVGRERERAKVADLVVDARVVTLTGPGGCGKTRLAVEVVGGVASRFSDGACWVDLQGVSDPGMVAPAVGAAVGVRERPDQALVATLAEQLHARHLLVVLDNCEHLVAACAELVGELSSACPQLHVLATSRVPLVVEGEATFEVAPVTGARPRCWVRQHGRGSGRSPVVRGEGPAGGRGLSHR